MPKTAAEKSESFREELSLALGDYLRETPPSKHSLNDFVAYLSDREA